MKGERSYEKAIFILASILLISIFPLKADSVPLRLLLSGSYFDVSSDRYSRVKWKDEYSAGLGLYYPVHSRILVGLALNYNRWRPVHDLSGAGWQIDKSALLWDIQPTVKLSFYDMESTGNIFARIGLGYTRVNQLNVLSQIAVPDPPPAEEIEILKEGSAFGFSLGAGMSLRTYESLLIEFGPSLHYIYHDFKYLNRNEISFYSVSAGISYRIDIGNSR